MWRRSEEWLYALSLSRRDRRGEGGGDLKFLSSVYPSSYFRCNIICGISISVVIIFLSPLFPPVSNIGSPSIHAARWVESREGFHLIQPQRNSYTRNENHINGGKNFVELTEDSMSIINTTAVASAAPPPPPRRPPRATGQPRPVRIHSSTR